MTKVGGFDLVEDCAGLWFLRAADEHIVATLLDMGNGTWRARTPGGDAVTVDVPEGVPSAAAYVARQIT